MDGDMNQILQEARYQGVENNFLNHFYSILSFAVTLDESVRSETIVVHARQAIEMAIKK